MADSKITALTALTGAGIATGDQFVMVDVSDTTMDATGTDKKMSSAELAIALGQTLGLVTLCQLYGQHGTSGALAATYDRLTGASTQTAGAATSGTLRLYEMSLPAGMIVTDLRAWAGTTAGASLTHSWMALFDASRNKVAISADNTTAAWGASTSRTFAMTSPYTVPTTGVYYAGLLIAGTTIPTIEASVGSAALLTAGSRNAAPLPGGNADAGLSTPATCPATATAITLLGQFAYFEVH